jgi:DNA topoisomerase IA
MKLVITEKKSQAASIATHMRWSMSGAHAKGTLEGDDVIMVWAQGHLLRDKDPNEVDSGFVWNDPTRLLPLPNIYEKVPTERSERYLDNIRKYIGSASEVIIATDADREGEAIGWNIIDYFNFKGPVRRAWFKGGLDFKNITTAFQNLNPSSEYRGFAYAAEARGRGDYNYMFLVVAYTYYARRGGFGPYLGSGSTGKETVMSVGRVQTTIANIILKRELEIENFVQTDHFNISSSFKAGNGASFEASYTPKATQSHQDRNPPGVHWEAVKPKGDEIPPDRPLFVGKAEVDAFKSRLLSDQGESAITAVDCGSRTESAGKTFDLSSAQAKIAKELKVSSSAAKKVLEDLYLQGWISYARTDFAELPASLYDPGERNPLIDSIQLPSLKGLADKVQLIHNGNDPDHEAFVPSFYTEAEMGHHGIIVTQQVMTQSIFDGLTPVSKEYTKSTMQNAYLIVAQQYLISHLPPAKYDTYKVVISRPVEDLLGNSESVFTAKSESLAYGGWRDIVKSHKDNSLQLPKLNQGYPLNLIEVAIKSSKTKPPSRYTEVTINTALKNIAKEERDPKYRKLLKDSKGVGTSATRSTAIQTITDRGYIQIKDSAYWITPKGRALIENVPPWLKSITTTAIWEDYLYKICEQKDMAKAVAMRDDFVGKQMTRITETINDLMAKFGKSMVKKPSEAQIKVLENIISRGYEGDVPPDAYKDSAACSRFIDSVFSSMKPSEGQIKYLKSIQNNNPDIKIPEDAFTSSVACSKFLNGFTAKNKKKSAKGSKSGNSTRKKTSTVK